MIHGAAVVVVSAIRLSSDGIGSDEKEDMDLNVLPSASSAADI